MFKMIIRICVNLTLLRVVSAGFCTQSYACNRACYKSSAYYYSCGWWNWGSCLAYRSVTEGCYGTCYRQTCCPGYSGSLCDIPKLSLEEPLRTMTTCDVSNVAVDCGQDMTVVIHSLQYAYRYGCDSTCCSYNEEDCFLDASTSELLDIRRTCSGQQACNHTITRFQIFCATGLAITSYVVLKHYCIPESRTVSIYNSMTLESDTLPLYLTNDRNVHRNRRSVGNESYSCSVEVNSCSSLVKLFTLDTDSIVDSTCTQTITFLESTNKTLYTIDCSNSWYTGRDEPTLPSNYLRIDVDTAAVENDDYFLLGFQATEPNVKFSIACSYEPELWCVDCGPVPDIKFGVVQLDSTNNSAYGATADVTCNPGFETNTSTIRCLEQGFWENATCSAKDCGTLPVIRFGNSSLNDVNNSTYGASGTVLCDAGFETNTPVITCMASGEWFTANCTVKDCGNVPYIANSIVTLNDGMNTTYGAWASVYCNYGYETDTPNITCQDSGQWSSSYCAGKDCGVLPMIKFGTAFLTDDTNSTYGASAYVVCADGYETNRTIIFCQASQIWETTVCYEKDCGTPPWIMFGTVSLVNEYNTKFGSSALVSCEMGYETSTRVITCQDTGQWMESVCLGKDCGQVQAFAYGVALMDDENNTTYGAGASVTCKPGYLASTQTITCQSNQTWSTAVCYGLDCGPLPSISLGTIVLNGYDNTTFGATATVLCETGYDTDTPNITCQATGKWQYPECMPKDCGLPFVSYGNVTLDEANNSTYGASATIECDTGFHTDIPVIVCSHTGNWTLSYCTGIECEFLPSISFGTAYLNDENNSTYGSSASVVCESGYNTSAPVIACLATGIWSTSTCKGIDCGLLPEIDHGEAVLSQKDNSTYGAHAYVNCSPGYETSVAVIECLYTGQWTSATCTAKDCGTVPSVAFGRVALKDGDNSTYGAMSDVFCNPGYETNVPIITCTASGLWEQSTCEAKDCGTVPLISFGTVKLDDSDNSTFGATAAVVCDAGYETLSSAITCQHTGTWSSSTCTALDCGPPPSITLGEILLKAGNKTTYGSSADVICQKGYVTDTPDINCMDNGQWSSSRCTGIDCGAVDYISYGHIALLDTSNTTYGASAEVTCYQGYETSSPVVTCLDSGNWSSAICVAKDCGQLPLVYNGNVTLDTADNSTYGAIAIVLCESGYEATMTTISCLHTGVWSETYCRGLDCGDVPLLQHGNASLGDISNSSYGANASVTCESGYVASSSFITCLNTGVWSIATCQAKDCGNVESIENGYITLADDDNITYGAIGIVTCRAGYETSENLVHCLDTGVWSTSYCTGKDCGPVRSIDFGDIILDDDGNTTFGTSATVTCYAGYETIKTNILCEESGNWETASCTPKDCGREPQISYGIVNPRDRNNTTYGALADVVCDNGYEASAPTLTCLDTGMWSSAHCIGIDCGPVPSIPFGSIRLEGARNTSYGASAVITCYAGYETNTPIIKCQTFGNWSSAECSPIDCGSYPTVQRGTYVPRENSLTTFGTVVGVVCDIGYSTISPFIICEDSGNWSASTCTGINCGDVPNVQFAQVYLDDDLNSTYGSSASVVCESGYDTSVPKIYCLASGTWSMSSCTGVDCGPVPKVSFGEVVLDNDDNTTYGATASVLCNTGYETRESEVMCLESGKWNTSVCSAKDCGEVPRIIHGQAHLIDESNTSFGTNAEITCDSGYITVSQFITCLGTGVWSTATCLVIDCGSVDTISNGIITLVDEANSTYGALAFVSCSFGYQQTDDLISCLDTGLWSESYCVGKDCGPVGSIEFGNITLSDYGNTTYGASANVFCHKGYETTKPDILCQASGVWETVTCSPKDCGREPQIPYGTVHPRDRNNSTFGAMADVNCDNGYEASEPTLTCLDTGMWSSSYCLGIDCGPLPSVPGGSIRLGDASNTSYGASAFLMCYAGYETNTPVINCQTSGNWSNAVCLPIDCGPYPTIKLGTVVPSASNSTTFGAVVAIVCDIGYTTSKSFLVCEDSGNWTTTICTGIDCGDIPVMPFANVYLDDDLDSTYGASASIVCESGYETSVSKIYCLASGTWSIFSCTGIDCGPGPTISFGEIVLSNDGNTTYGASASLLCETGYESKESEITCLETGQWSISECSAKDCGEVPSITHGSAKLHDIFNSTIGANAEVTCDPGYITVAQFITCLSVGVWSEVTCQAKDCGSLETIAYGNISLVDEANSTYGAEAIVTCSSGYQSSASMISCLDTGLWSQSYCTGKDCGPVGSIEFGTPMLNDDSNTTYGASAFVICQRGYETMKPEIFCQASGVWEAAICTGKDCGAVPTITYGATALHNVNNSSYGALADVVCEDGYLASKPTVTCLESGIWETAYCFGKDCGPVPFVPFGRIRVEDIRLSNTTYGTSASLTCYDGYESQTPVISCLATGNWTGPVCSPKDCGLYPKVLHGEVIADDSNTTIYGTVVGVMCELGYITYKPFLICEDSGSWSSSVCMGIDCGPIPAITFGKAELSEMANSTYGATATVTCNAGYQTSTGVISCQAVAKWTTAECTPVGDGWDKTIIAYIIAGIVLVFLLVVISVVVYKKMCNRKADIHKTTTRTDVVNTRFDQFHPKPAAPNTFTWQHNSENEAGQITSTGNTSTIAASPVPPFPPKSQIRRDPRGVQLGLQFLAGSSEISAPKNMTRGISATFSEPYDDMGPTRQFPRIESLVKSLQATPEMNESPAEYMEHHEPCEEAYTHIDHPNASDLEQNLEPTKPSHMDDIEEHDPLHNAYSGVHFPNAQELEDAEVSDDISFSLNSDSDEF